MYEDIPAARTLARAAELCGGVQTLARLLGVPVSELSGWIAGTAVAPLEIYLRALEFVARTRLTRDE
jgi:hypothetical protein